MLLTISSFSTGKLCRFSESFLGFLGAAGEVDGDATSATAWVPIVRSTLPLFPLLEAVHRGAIRTAPVAVAPSEAIMLSTQGYKVKGGERGEEEEEKKERDKESALVLDSLSSSSLLVVSRARKQLPPPAHHHQQHRQALPTHPSMAHCFHRRQPNSASPLALPLHLLQTPICRPTAPLSPLQQAHVYHPDLPPIIIVPQHTHIQRVCPESLTSPGTVQPLSIRLPKPPLGRVGHSSLEGFACLPACLPPASPLLPASPLCPIYIDKEELQRFSTPARVCECVDR